LDKSTNTTVNTHFPTLEYTSEGRGGYVFYLEKEIRIAFEWEIAAGNAVAIIYIPKEEYWESRTKTAVGRRAEILEFVANETLAKQAKGGRFEIDADSITLFRD
jgi:hypothetical protein